MSTITREVALWGINRPDGSPVTKSPRFASSIWSHNSGQYGYPDSNFDAAATGAQELSDALVRLGVHPDNAKHEVVHVVVNTTIRRNPWPEAG